MNHSDSVFVSDFCCKVLVSKSVCYVQDIDPEVLAALPAEVRREVRLALMAQRKDHQQGAPGKRGGGAAAASRPAAKRGRPASRSDTAPITKFYSAASAPSIPDRGK